MLSSPVYTKLQPGPPVSHPHRALISLSFSQPSNLPTFQRSNVILIHPLSFQSLPHSFPQWTTPISFPFNRFHTLSIVMGGGGTLAFKNLNHHFNLSSSLQAAPFHQNYLRPFVSTTYKLPIFYPLCFDIHPCNGGVGGCSARKFLKKNLNCLAISRETRNKRSFSRSDDRKFWREDKQDRRGEFGADYRVQFNDSLGNQEACRQRRSRIQ
jgi:hypothetical protein